MHFELFSSTTKIKRRYLWSDWFVMILLFKTGQNYWSSQNNRLTMCLSLVWLKGEFFFISGKLQRNLFTFEIFLKFIWARSKLSFVFSLPLLRTFAQNFVSLNCHNNDVKSRWRFGVRQPSYKARWNVSELK